MTDTETVAERLARIDEMIAFKHRQYLAEFFAPDCDGDIVVELCGDVDRLLDLRNRVQRGEPLPSGGVT